MFSHDPMKTSTSYITNLTRILYCKAKFIFHDGMKLGFNISKKWFCDMSQTSKYETIHSPLGGKRRKDRGLKNTVVSVRLSTGGYQYGELFWKRSPQRCMSRHLFDKANLHYLRVWEVTYISTGSRIYTDFILPMYNEWSLTKLCLLNF